MVKQSTEQVNVLEIIYTSYRLTDNKGIIEAIHPPATNIEMNESTRAIPWKTINIKDKTEKATSEGINQILEQNNYTNLFLQYVGKQLNRIESKIDKKQILKGETNKSNEKEKPIFRMPTKEPDFKLRKNNEDIMTELISRLVKLDISDKKDKSQIIILERQPQDIEQSENENNSEENIEDFEKNFSRLKY